MVSRRSRKQQPHFVFVFQAHTLRTKMRRHLCCIASILIANKGAVLICNRQIQEKKLSELPENLIIIAKANDFKSDVSEAMTAINKKYKHNLPSNITTLNAFDPTKENDFLSYGGNAKHLYLLVQEVN